MALVLLAVSILLVQETVHTSADIVANLSPSGEKSKCGETISMNPGNETTVYASGNVPNGHCSMYFRTTKSADHVCDKICVTLRSMKFDVCYVKVKFTAINFDNKADQTKKFDCWNSFNDVWCPTTTKLQLDVLESDHYHYQFDTKDKYDFSVDINPFCTPIKEKVNPATSNFNKKRDDRLKQIKIEGVVAGVCLASIFLVLLIVMYIYYKSKPTNNVPEETTGKASRGRVFANMKERFMGRRKSNVVCIENETFDTYQQVRQTDDDVDEDIQSPQQSKDTYATANNTQHGEKETCNSSV